MDKQPNNPAGRLLKVIENLKGIQRSNNGIRTYNGWAMLFGIDESRIGLVMCNIGVTLQLTEEIARILKKTDDDNEIFYRDLDQIADSFRQMNLQQRLNDTLNRIKESSITGLEYINHFIGSKMPEKIFDREDLKKIKKAILELMDEIVAGDIDQYLKSYLIDKLDMLRQAVEMYDYTGSKPVEIAIDSIVGSSQMNKSVKEAGKKILEVKKFFYILYILMKAGSYFNDTTQLPENLAKLFSDSKQVAVEILDSDLGNNIQEDCEIVDELLTE